MPTTLTVFSVAASSVVLTVNVSPTLMLLAVANSFAITTLLVFWSLVLMPRPDTILAVPSENEAVDVVDVTPLI